MKRFPRCAAVFGWIAKLYSPQFQTSFADDMAELFARQCDDVRERSGTFGLTLFAAQTFASMFVFGLMDRTVALLDRRLSSRRRSAPAPRGGLMSSFLQDVGYGVRSMAKSPAFATIAVLTLALGIAVNTTIFSLVNALLFRELPVAEPDTFVFVWATNDRAGQRRSPLTLQDVQALRAESESFEGVAAGLSASFTLSGDAAEPVEARALRVTDDFHHVWGIGTVVGRGFLTGEDRAGAPPIAILSHGFWDRRYGRDPGVVGDIVELDGEAHTIVGVLSPKIEFGDVAFIDVWVPLGLDLDTALAGERSAFATARLRNGVHLDAAREEASLVASRLSESRPESHSGWGLRVSPVEDELLNDDDTLLGLVTLFCVAFVLLIACANVANMFVARATSRSRELAVRLALGASRRRLVRQFVTEGVVLALVAGALGVVLARGLTDLLVVLSLGQQWIYTAMELDRNVFLFALSISLLTPLVFALAPSLGASRVDIARRLREGGRAGAGRSALRSRGALVVVQVAMALALMIVTGLVVQTVRVLRNLDLGFEPRGLLATELRPPERSYPADGDRRRFFETLIERASTLPGATAAAVVSHSPLSPGIPQRTFSVEGVALEGDERPAAQLLVASPEYFSTMQISLSRGRHFGSTDDDTGTRVAIINERAATRYWPDRDVVGRRIRPTTPEDAPWLEIVGVVRDVIDLDTIESTSARDTAAPQVYVPMSQSPVREMSLVVRASGAPAGLATPVREQVKALDAGFPVVTSRTMSDLLEELHASNNAVVGLFLVFAGFALAMASTGIYAVMSFAVSQREHEIGIRMALGASASEVARLVVSQGSRLVLIGAGIGLAIAVLLGQFLSRALMGVSPLDPASFLGVPAVLLLVALAANYFPARRATRIDPIQTLRAE